MRLNIKKENPKSMSGFKEKCVCVCGGYIFSSIYICFDSHSWEYLGRKIMSVSTYSKKKRM